MLMAPTSTVVCLLPARAPSSMKHKTPKPDKTALGPRASLRRDGLHLSASPRRGSITRCETSKF
eukprot:11834376-Prorocentrum_lima.AAC.1